MENHHDKARNNEKIVYLKLPILCTFRFYIFVIIAFGTFSYLYLYWNESNYLFLVLILALLYLWWQFNAWQMHYIGISNNKLIIKNTLKPYKNKSFFWSEIKVLKIESLIKFPRCVTIVDNKGSKKFHASLLSKAQWKQFIVLVKEKNIPIVIEDSELNN